MHRGSYGTTRLFTGNTFRPSTNNPYYLNSLGQNNTSRIKTDNERAKLNKTSVYFSTTNYEFQNTNYRRPVSTTYRSKENEHTTDNLQKIVNATTTEDSNAQSKNGYKNRRITDYEDISDIAILKLMNSLLESHLNDEDDGTPTESTWNTELTSSLLKEHHVDVQNSSKTDDNLSLAETTTVLQTDTEGTTNDDASTIPVNDANEDNITYAPTLEALPTTTYETTNDFQANTTAKTMDTTTETQVNISGNPVTFKTVTNTTDCVENEIHASEFTDSIEKRHDSNVIYASTTLGDDANAISKLQEVTNLEFVSTEATENSSEITSTEHDITEVDLEFKVNVATATTKPFPKIELLQNLTKTKEDGIDYDYNDLPPSLPNLR